MIDPCTRQGLAVLLLVTASSTSVLGLGRQAAAPPAQPAKATAVAAVTLPPAQEILDRHTKAVGGREAILARSSSVARGTVTIASSGITGTILMYSATPNKKLARSVVPGIGEIEEGYDGTTAWSISPITGPALVTGAELEQRKLDNDFHGLNLAAAYESITTIEQVMFDGRPCYKLKLVRRGGGEDFHFYDVATGLKAGSIITRDTPMGAMTISGVETDYKVFGGIRQATRLVSTMLGLQHVITVDSIEYDKVDPAVFEPPAVIKALIK